MFTVLKVYCAKGMLVNKYVIKLFNHFGIIFAYKTLFATVNTLI